MLEPNALLQGRYRIVRILGQGGMGTVFEATDERFGSRVAIKQALVLDAHLAGAFEREARLLRTLRHAALPGVIDYFVEGNLWFLVMDYVAGEDFSALAERAGGPLPVASVLAWGDQLLEVLGFLHDHSPPIVHRDVKPQNLKLTPEGRIVLLDFGLAKGAAGDMATTSAQKSIYGYTPQYAPLEQIRGSGTDPRSDLYAAAATLWSLLTGQAPPDALGRASAIVTGQRDPMRPAHELNPAVPERVSAALHWALAQAPAERPASAHVLRQRLRDGATAAPGDPATRVERRDDPYATRVDRHGNSFATVAEARVTTAEGRNDRTLAESGRSPAAVHHAEPRRSSVPLVVVAIALVAIGVAVPFVIAVFAGSFDDTPSTTPAQNDKKSTGATSDTSKPVGSPIPVTVDLLAVANPSSPSNAFGDSGLNLGSGTIRVEPASENTVMPPGASRLIFFFGPGFSGPYGYHAAEVTLDGVATSVTVTRPGVRNNASTPAWKLQALDASGAQVGTAVGEGDIERGNYMFPSGPQDYTITAPGIKRLRFASNNNQSTFAAIPFTRVSVTMVK